MIQAIRKFLLNPLGIDLRRFPEKHWSTIAEHYYPIDAKPRWGYGLPPHPQINQFLETQKTQFAELLSHFLLATPHLKGIPIDGISSGNEPYWNNVWFSTLDAAALVCMLALKSPRKYVEIGGGFSTRFSRYLINIAKSPTRIISIDPLPRATIDELCDEIVRKPLEELDPSFFDELDAGDFLFFDGSHRVFTNSDVTAFFFDVLPRLRPGVIIHIHDVFWPDDYPPQWRDRFYSEQYLLGMIFLYQSQRYRLLLPNHFVWRHGDTSPMVEQLGIPTVLTGIDSSGPSSVWLQIN